jgi:Asp-tRNA(Asn)/Glu-tRNA(Gln) amidotransferase A subunit family amidase
MDLLQEPVSELARRVQARELSARELVEASLERIEATNDAIGAFVALDPEGALVAAAELDERVAQGLDAGPLAGIPVGVKDLEDVAGLPTSRGSRLFADRGPAARDSELVSRLRAAGCIVVGKTNTPELGHKADTTNLVFPPTCNPWDPSRSAGGSSGGSAAAVAAGMVPLATGSDGGGSIRIPSALCGLSGMKPSLGRVPSGGRQAPDWQHLSTKGPMATRIADVALALDAVIGPEQTDLRSLPMPEASWVGAVANPHVPLRVAWSPTLGYGRTDAGALQACEQAITVLDELGAEVVEVDVFADDPVMVWFTLTAAYLARTVGPDADLGVLDPTLRPFVETGRTLTAVQVVEAEDECHRLNLRLVDLFAEHSVLVTPTVAGRTPVIGEPGLVDGEPEGNWVRYTYPFNCTRSPAGTVCAGLDDDGMPVGLQVVGPQHGDQVVLRTLAALEQALGVVTPPR